MKSQIRPTLWLVVMVLLASGCQRQPDKWEQSRLPTVPVTGAVLLDGEPITEATVIFHNGQHAVSATALTADDGRFSLRTYVPDDGAPPGEYTVSIEKITEHQKKPENPEAPLPPVEITHHLPQRYRNPKASGLTAEVTEAGPNEFVFELSKK